MNPSDNNPISPSGAGGMSGGTTSGSSAVPGPVDFTNSSSLSSSSSLSMADSLASAQDDLTSAGQAASTGLSGAVGLDSLGAEPATMISPDQGLTPAAPVPGSIGSAMSMPPIAPSPSAMAGADSTSTATTTGNPFLMGAGSSVDSSASSANTAGASATKPVQPYFNPFARTQGSGTSGSTNPTSSSKVPPALQPQSEKFSAQAGGAAGKKGNSSIVSMLGWIVAVVFAITTALFVFLWMTKEGEDRIIYQPVAQQPKPEPEAVTKKSTVLKCGDNGREVAESELESMPGLVSISGELIVSYTDGIFTDMTNLVSYSFVDIDAASAAKTQLDLTTGLIGAVAGETGISASVSQFDNVLSLGMVTPASALTVEGVDVSSDFPKDEEGNINTDMEAVRSYYEGQGAVCTVENN